VNPAPVLHQRGRDWVTVLAQTVRGSRGLATVTWLLATVLLLELSTVIGTVHSVEATTDSLPLAVAGGPSLPVIGFLGVGFVRIYVPLTAVAVVVLGELAHRRVPHGRVLQAVAGVAAASQLLVLAGCGCGTGGVTPLGKAAVLGLFG